MNSPWLDAVGHARREFAHELALLRAHFTRAWSDELGTQAALAFPGETSEGARCADRAFSAWDAPAWADGALSSNTQAAASLVRLGTLVLQGPHSPDRLVRSVPAVVPLIGSANLMLEASGDALAQANNALESVAYRVLAAVAPGNAQIIAIDAQGLGQNLNAFFSLPEGIKGPKILHEPSEIRSALSALKVHVATVTQKFLGNTYATIDHYNKRAGAVAEPYRLLVVAGFPLGFSAETANDLLIIARSGPRVGVHVLLSRDPQHPLPHGFSLADLVATGTVLRASGKSFAWPSGPSPSSIIELDQEPPVQMTVDFAARLGAAVAGGRRVEIRAESLRPDAMWTHTSTEGISAVIGQVGATEPQLLSLGAESGERPAVHALIAGRTGSGKSVLLHSLICNLADRYSPGELEFFLVDFKQGVEFAVYRNLPHARVVAVEADREFAVSVLQHLVSELERRGSLCSEQGVTKLSDYRKKVGSAPAMSRIVLLVDEFQMFFQDHGALSERARLLLEQLVRQGRSYGVHVVLASQTLTGADLSQATLSSISIRVALMMSEADAHKILDKDNDEAKVLSRPGEAIFNAHAGQRAGNKRFQVAYLPPERVRVRVERLNKQAAERGLRTHAAVVYEGSKSESIRNNVDLQASLIQRPAKLRPWFDLYFGKPLRMQDGHAFVRMRRQSRGNVLVVGNNEKLAFQLVAASLASIAAQTPQQQGTVRALNLCNVESEVYEAFTALQKLPIEIRVLGRSEVDECLSGAAEELARRRAQPRTTGTAALSPPQILLIFGLQRAHQLKKAGASYSAAAKGIKEILSVGPDLGLHTIVWSDTLNAAKEVLSAGELAEFGARVALLGADSGVIGSPGGVVSGIRANHALLATDDEPGVTTKISCYGADIVDWLSGLGGSAEGGGRS